MLKKTLLCIYIWSSCWGQIAYGMPLRETSSILLNPNLHSPGKFLLSKQDYQDIRVDSDLDGKTDFWILKKNNLEIKTRYDKKGKISFIYLAKPFKKSVLEAVYIPSAKGFRLVASGQRANRLMHGSVENNSCIAAKENILKKMEQFSSQVSQNSIANTVEDFFDSKCLDQLSTFKIESKALVTVIASNQVNKSFVDCLQDGKFKNGLTADQSLAVDVLSAQLRLNLVQIAHGDKTPKMNIKCEATANEDEISGTYMEGGGFLIKAPKNSEWNDKLAFEKIFLHELLHQAGSPNDAFINKALAICYNSLDVKTLIINNANIPESSINQNFKQEAINSSAAVSNSTSGSINPTDAKPITPTTLNETKQSVNNGDISQDLNMAKEITVAQPLPSAQQLAAVPIDKSPEGLSAALDTSEAQSAPMFRMANQAMGSLNVPAIAAADRSVSSSTEDYSRDTSSSSSAKTAASKSSGRTTTSRDGLKSGERVVEQIEVDTSKNIPVATNETTQPQQSAMQAKNSLTTNKVNNRAPASMGKISKETNSDVASANSSAFSPSSASSLNSSPDAPQRSAQSPNNATRRPSSASGSSSNGDSSNRDEVVTFFSRGNYSTAKSKLKDQGFVTKLKQNKITVIDLYGNSFGAGRGDVIFLDEGSRFVRQK